MQNEKTHWLQSPNKNYLGHWDLPESGEITLTMKHANWEAVKNPINNTTESKRVIRFYEDVKPMICNQTNAQSILNATGTKFMEDCDGHTVTLYRATIVDRRTKEDIDCIRVRKQAAKPAKPSMTPENPKWDAAMLALEQGNVTIEDIEKKYAITPQDKKKLLGWSK